MSSNPFGALNDDSDDESSPVVSQPTRTTTAPKATKPMTKTAQKKAAQAKKAAEAAKAVAAANATAKSTANSNEPSYGKDKVHTRTGGRDTHGRNASGPGRVNREKREYDRRDGSGRGKDVKKNGAGAHNWGEPGTDAVEGEEAAAAPVEGEAAEEVEPEVVVVQLTMEEYEAVRAAKRTGEAFGALKASKTVEDVSGDRYEKNTNVQEGFMQFGGAKEKRVRNTKKQVKTRFTDTSFKIRSADAPPPEREERRGGDRGGRGGSRGGSRGGRDGGEGRGGFRGGRGGGAGGREGGREGGEGRGGFRGGRGGARGGSRGGRGGARGGAAAAGPGPVGAGRPAQTGPRGAINPNDASAFPALGA